ncbi:MAG: LysR family transcriptional regulator [Acidaminococcales bacterium]|jgi:DNA-binding transcriptional LysR family regulator|nr:LysR family transcriptional regulator [Acidaminococcales bacterium]
MMMNTNQLKCFMAIVRTKSFSVAAYDLFLSQSAVSKQIKSLEDELEVILFKREPQKISLTEAGAVFRQYAESALKLYNEILLTLEPHQVSGQSTIAMGSIPVVSSYGVSSQIAVFTSRQTRNISFDMHENSQNAVLKELQESIIDIALVRLESIANREDYDIIPYVFDHIALVCHKNNPLATKSAVYLKEVVGQHLLLLDRQSAIYHIVMSEFERQQLAVKIQFQTTRHKILMSTLASSVSSVSLAPPRLVDFSIFPNLVVVPLVETLTSCVALIKHKSKKLNRVTQAFWEYWRTECALPNAENK